MAKAKKQAVSAHDLDRIIVRLPEGMRDRIADLAEANGRSMTAEVVAALEQHLKGPDRLAGVEAFIDEYRESIDGIGLLWDAVENLESYAEGLGDGFRGLLRSRQRKIERDARVAALPLITPDQVKEIRQLLKSTGANEDRLLRYLNVDKIEDIREVDRARAAIRSYKGNPPA